LVIFFHFDKNSHHFVKVLSSQSKSGLNQPVFTLPKESKNLALLFESFSASINKNCIQVFMEANAAGGNFFSF
jgi:hypothetical protein